MSTATPHPATPVGLVTGAAPAIGRAIALAYARTGAKVVVSDTQAEGGEQTVALVRSAGGDAIFVAADLSKAAALEYGAQGVRINAVGPAFIRTPMIARPEDDPATQQALVAMHPIGRLGQPEDVAELVLWLSSRAASFVTGAYSPVDGGFLAR